MSSHTKIYCLDANVLIQAWQKYYAPTICPSYWEILNIMGEEGRVFISEMVYKEILRTEDDLNKWLKSSNIPVRKIDEEVTKCLRSIYSANPYHKYLVDSTKNRSLADPWVIAHALNENATVVTKEEKALSPNPKKIKIPNVCENMQVACINDFQFIEELGLKFHCEVISK
jgi:predicted nucleic acid-binding protein